ncbi:hypothetical protein ABBQ38_002979 [Trebouxia sp. C0009 RCD-2024]
MYTKTSFLRPLRHLSFTSIWLQQHNPPKGYQAGRRLSAQIKAANINASEQKYDALLQKGKHWTFDAPEGQLLGRAGRRCVLEDGERALLTCIVMRPEALSPRVLLMTNLILQNRGREREVPLLAIQTLKRTRLQRCLVACSIEDIDSSVHVVELGLRALKKAGREHSMRRFVQDAVAAMPALASEFKSVARNRFHVDPDVAVQPSHKPFQDFLTSEDIEDGQA